MIATTQPQNTPLLLSPWHNKLAMMSRFWQNIWPPISIATHLSIGHMPYRQMRGDWHRLAKMAAKRHSPQAAMQAAGRHPLSYADNIKIIALIILVILLQDLTI
jgi:hypothetical protein